MFPGKDRQGQPRSLPGKWKYETVVWPFSLVHRTRNEIKGGKKKKTEAKRKQVGTRGSHNASVELCQGHVVQGHSMSECRGSTP